MMTKETLGMVVEDDTSRGADERVFDRFCSRMGIFAR